MPKRCTTATKIISVAAANRLATRISSRRSRMRSMKGANFSDAAESPPVLLVRGAARFFQEVIDDSLPETRRHFLVNGLHGITQSGVLVGGQFQNRRLAGFLDFLERFGVLLLRNLIAVFGRVSHCLFQL